MSLPRTRSVASLQLTPGVLLDLAVVAHPGPHQVVPHVQRVLVVVALVRRELREGLAAAALWVRAPVSGLLPPPEHLLLVTVDVDDHAPVHDLATGAALVPALVVVEIILDAEHLHLASSHIRSHAHPTNKLKSQSLQQIFYDITNTLKNYLHFRCDYLTFESFIQDAISF